MGVTTSVAVTLTRGIAAFLSSRFARCIASRSACSGEKTSPYYLGSLGGTSRHGQGAHRLIDGRLILAVVVRRRKLLTLHLSQILYA